MTRDRRARMGDGRRGTTLLEIVVALPLAVLACAIAAVMLVHLSRRVRNQQASAASQRELRHAWIALAHDLAPLGTASLHLVTDSLIEFDAQLGLGIVCAISGPREILVASVSVDDDWIWSVRAGDAVDGHQYHAEAGHMPDALRRILRQPAAAEPMGPCGGRAQVRRFELAFTHPTGPISIGSPVHVRRRTRYLHYASGSRWWLGKQVAAAGGWGLVQPVAGPFLSRTQLGVRFAALSAAGGATTADSAATVALTLRAPRRIAATGSLHDSLRLLLPLRADAARRGHP